MRTDDERIERVIGDYLDQHFYPRLGRAERITDERQFKGVDVFLETRSGKTYNIDEKAKYDGLINQDVSFIGFELSRRIRTGERRDGWFLDQDSETDLYAIISPFLREGDTPERILPGNIKELHVLIVSPRNIWAWLKDEHNLARRDIRERVEEMSRPGVREWARWPNSSDWTVKLKRSDHLEEQPVNLVLRRSTLIQEMGAGEVIVSEEGVRRIPARR